MSHYVECWNCGRQLEVPSREAATYVMQHRLCCRKCMHQGLIR